LIWLGYPDGELDFAPRREIQIGLIKLIRTRRPDVVFALDPGATYFRYHYRDHRSAALIAADAIGAAQWPLEYPAAGKAYAVPETYYFYTAEPNVRLDISSIYEKKLAALARHRSQFPPALNHFTPAGPAPSTADLEGLIKPLTGSAKIESFRRR
jgi:LmbE family N-acetylglucosaminyl deacetylase